MSYSYFDTEEGRDAVLTFAYALKSIAKSLQTLCEKAAGETGENEVNVLVITDSDRDSFEGPIVYLLSNSWSKARRQAKELFLSDVETEKQETESSLDENLTFWDDDADYGMITWASGFTTKYVLALVNNLPSPKK